MRRGTCRFRVPGGRARSACAVLAGHDEQRLVLCHACAPSAGMCVQHERRPRGGRKRNPAGSKAPADRRDLEAHACEQPARSGRLEHEAISEHLERNVRLPRLVRGLVRARARLLEPHRAAAGGVSRRGRLRQRLDAYHEPSSPARTSPTRTCGRCGRTDTAQGVEARRESSVLVEDGSSGACPSRGRRAGAVAPACRRSCRRAGRQLADDRRVIGFADDDGTGASEQEIPLRHRQHGGRLAGQQLAVGAHLVGLGIDLDMRAWRR